MIQNLVVIALAAWALWYLGRRVYHQFKASDSCETGCGKCAEARRPTNA